MRLFYAPLVALPLINSACVIVSDDDDSAADTEASTDTADTDATDGADETGMPASPQTCADVDRSAMGEAPETESAEITLSGVLRVSDRLIYDSGEIVTIEPGTVFLMEADAQVLIGWRGDPATVFAEGTAEQPILFCGTSAGAGHWLDLQVLTGTTTDSVLEHVRIEDAGQGDVPALLQSVDVLLDNITITGNAGPGFELAGLASGSADLFVTGNGGVTGTVDGESAISNLPAGDYTGNGEDVLLATGHENTNVVFHDRGVPYRQLPERVVFGRADGVESSFTLEAGVEYQFCQDCHLIVGWRGDPAVIDVQGTDSAPVVFTSSEASPAAGDWNGLRLEGGTRSNSRIAFAQFEYGGKADAGNLIIAGGLGSIENSTFSNSAGWGILVEGEREAGLTLANNEFADNALGPVSDGKN